ncbi:MAG TPA: CARDB domain-containing protein [Candidatus Nanoarchaeia archaeon]|nr:CARDB domain-containing protein [Candidatus Nanoarchaeia archaeon]
MKRFLFLFIVISLIILPICSAAQYILGTVEDAKDGTPADGHTILLWNSTVGIQDNLSDIIGPTGNSGVNNNYSINCELLDSPCKAGDTLTLKVIDNGDNYVSEEKNVTIITGPETYAENITLNSPPETNLIFPLNFANFSNPQVVFNCSASDLDNNLKEISLYENWTGGWNLNETKEINQEGFITFTKILQEGFYKWACKVIDNLSISSFSSQNNSFTVDLTEPIINSVLMNISNSSQIPNAVRVNCTTYDERLTIDKVIIQAISPSETTNYSSSFLIGETYYSDIQLDENGNWTFNCIANDSAGNVNNMTSESLQVLSYLADLFINYTNINLNESYPFENQNIFISALVENLGGIDAENVLISFFEGDPHISGTSIGNVTINVSSISSAFANVSWNAKIGPTNIFVIADYDSKIEEENESNNEANKTFSINSWQDIYGNISVDKIVGNEATNIKVWFNESNMEGNIFITDSECSVNWLTLQAIGKDKFNEDSSNDFSEIDGLLGMTLFEDSVSNLFSDNQIPKKTTDLLIYQKETQNIPFINSTDNSPFITGILWDYSDDTEDNEFDSEDKEDIVFVAKINKNTQGEYGFYDYEVSVPSKLREYNPLDSNEIYLYYDLN